MNSDERKLVLLTGVFITALIIANTLASKIFSIGPFFMTAGIIAYPLTFLVTDVVNDVWGKKRAQHLVMVGFVTNIIMVLLYQLAIALPAVEFWEGQEAFRQVLGAVPRITAASMVAYLISQHWDVWLFTLIKEKLKYGLWLRNNVGTMTSQAIDSAIFLVLAFGGTMTWSAIGSMYVSYLVVKWIIALVDTPFCYLGVKWARGRGNV